MKKFLIKEENNKRGKTRDLFRKFGNIKGDFCPKMGNQLLAKAGRSNVYSRA